jgi:hypothetical protein
LERKLGFWEMETYLTLKRLEGIIAARDRGAGIPLKMRLSESYVRLCLDPSVAELRGTTRAGMQCGTMSCLSRCGYHLCGHPVTDPVPSRAGSRSDTIAMLVLVAQSK